MHTIHIILMRARQYVAVASAFIFNLFKAEDLGIESSCCRQKWPLDAPNVWQKVLQVFALFFGQTLQI